MYALRSSESDTRTRELAHPPGLAHRRCSWDPGPVESVGALPYALGRLQTNAPSPS